MSEYGLTENGFNKKSRVEIEEVMKQRAKNHFGDNVNLSDNSPLGKIIKNTAYELAENWQAGESVYNSSFVDFATGVSLDYLCKLIGISRRSATSSTGEQTFYGDNGVIIPEGFLVETEDGIGFITTESGIVESGSITLPIESVGTGSENNIDAGFITEIINPISGLESTENLVATTGARDREEDFELRDRFEQSVARGGASTIDSIRASLLQLDNVIDAIINENNTMETSQGKITVTDTSTSDGDIIISINQLSEINATHYNLEYTISILSTDTTTEIASKIASALNVDDYFDGITSSTNIVTISDSYLNIVDIDFNANTTDSSAGAEILNMPSKSIECFVYGGTDEDIYTSIFDTKAAGIMAYGNNFYSVEDSLGNFHPIGFSRPDFIDTWVNADITTNDVFPLDGNTQVQTEIIKYIGGIDEDNTEYVGLGLGEDVIRTRIIAAIHNVDGIIDVDLTIGTESSSLSTSNIEINTEEVAITDDTKVEVV